MSHWIDFLVDSAPVKAIFGDQIPSGRGLTLHDITIGRDGPGIILRFDFPEFPADPPAKWAKKQFNRVQITLDAGAVHDLSIYGVSTEMLADLDLAAEDSRIRLHFHGSAIDIKALVDGILVVKLSAYQVSEP